MSLPVNTPSWMQNEEDEVLFGEALSYANSPEEFAYAVITRTVCKTFVDNRKVQANMSLAPQAVAPVVASSFAPTLIMPVNLIKLKTSFPEVILNKKDQDSIHASSILSVDDNNIELLKAWFESELAFPLYFVLKKPEDGNHAQGSRKFVHYVNDIQQLGYTVWDIQDKKGETVSVLLEDSRGIQKKLSGRADYIIATNDARSIGAATYYARCVIVVQNKENEEACEYQLVTYLVILMNRYGFQSLAGILIYTDGRCRGYRARRDSDNDAIYEQNDTFYLYQIAAVLPELLGN